MRKAIVTGAAGTIGRAIANKLRSDGFAVCGIDLNVTTDVDFFIQGDLVNVVKENAHDYNSLRRWVGNSLELLVNNAAVQLTGPIGEYSETHWDRTIDVNLKVPYILSQLLNHQLINAGGSIINISSIHSGQSKPGFFAYAASKGGLDSLTRALAVEFAGKVRVNAIAPAAIDTEMLRDGFAENSKAYEKLKEYHPSGRIGKPEEIAELVSFLASDKAAFINGAVLGIDGGISGRLHDPA